MATLKAKMTRHGQGWKIVLRSTGHPAQVFLFPSQAEAIAAMDRAWTVGEECLRSASATRITKRMQLVRESVRRTA